MLHHSNVSNTCAASLVFAPNASEKTAAGGRQAKILKDTNTTHHDTVYKCARTQRRARMKHNYAHAPMRTHASACMRRICLLMCVSVCAFMQRVFTLVSFSFPSISQTIKVKTTAKDLPALNRSPIVAPCQVQCHIHCVDRLTIHLRIDDREIIFFGCKWLCKIL